jgi:hypothetical protein
LILFCSRKDLISPGTPLYAFSFDSHRLASASQRFATVGIPAALLLYSVKRMRALAGPHVELEAQHIINIVMAFPTTEESLQRLEMLVRRADFGRQKHDGKSCAG